MIGARRASRQCQLGKANPRRNMRRLFVKRAPQRIERFQPTKQCRISHRRKCASEILIQVVMRVHQARSDETIRCINNTRCFRLGARSTHARNQTVGDGNPTASDLAALIINRCNEPRVANNEVGCCAQLFSSTSSLPAWRISASRCRK